jgi:hypothetical protein
MGSSFLVLRPTIASEPSGSGFLLFGSFALTRLRSVVTELMEPLLRDQHDVKRILDARVAAPESPEMAERGIVRKEERESAVNHTSKQPKSTR